MKRLVGQVIVDMVLYLLLYLAIAESNMYAENVVSFFVIFIGGLSAVLVFCSGECIKEVVKKSEGKYSLSLRYWCRISTIVEVSIFASQGWYVMAVLWLFALVFHIRCHEAYDELFGKPNII